MAASIKAVIFDMDGLMIDSEGKQSLAIEWLLREQGTEPVLTEQGIVHIAGIRATDNLQRLKDHHQLAASIDDLHTRKDELYRQTLAEGVDVMPGLPELLDSLSQAPVKKALASGSSKPDITIVLRHLKLENYFDAVVSGYEVAHGKPAPDIFLEAAKRLTVTPEYCVVFEDSGTGVQAAKAAGMKVIAVPNRYTKSHDFDAADLIVGSLAELSWQVIKNL